VNNNTQLMRSSNDKILAGVCGGLAEYFGIDSTIVRLIFVVAVLSGVSPFIYVILWIVMPQKRVVGQASYPQPQQQALPQPPSQASVSRNPSYYEGQENWKYDPMTGEKIEGGES